MRPGEQACSTDGLWLLVCREGKMAAALACRGAKGCRANGPKLDCDMTFANVGDACESTMEGHHACGGDQTTIVACKNRKFVVDEPCARGKRCKNEDGSVRCR